MHKSKSGKIHLDMKFGQALTQSHVILMYMAFSVVYAKKTSEAFAEEYI